MEDNKMKTIAYNPQKEIFTALLILMLSFCLLTAVKAQGNSVPTLVNEVKTEFNEDETFKKSSKDLTENEISDNYLVMKIESWIKNASYWSKSSEETVENQLADKIKRWMSNGSFWSPDKNMETDIDQLALLNKSEMSRNALYADEK
jgi:hypothetical protein